MEAHAAIPVDEVVAIAEDYEKAGRLRKAERLVHRAIAAAPQHPGALLLAGIVASRLDRPAEALDWLSQALAHGPDTALYLRNLCEVYRSLGRLDEAIAAARRASSLAPNDPLCLHNQSVIHYHRGELTEALACADAALAIRPAMAGAHLARAEILLLRGAWAQGWEEYEWRFRASGARLIPPDQVRHGIPQWQGRGSPRGGCC